MRSIEVTDSPVGSASVGSSNTWSVCSSGNILCSKVDGSEKYAIYWRVSALEIHNQNL